MQYLQKNLLNVRWFLFLMTLLLIIVSTRLWATPELLLKSDQSWNGALFSYLNGEAEITSVKLKLEAGKETPFHCHPVPTMGYILKGVVKLETPDGKSKIYKAGDSVIELMKQLHRGLALSEQAEIIVFYAGVKDVPVTVFPDDKENFKKFCQ